MKSKQFCSVCKEWLDMEVVPTNDGDEDDGVIWFRCPQCQGFLPKLSGADLQEEEPAADDAPAAAGDADRSGTPAPEAAPDAAGETDGDDMPWDSPAAMMAAREKAGERDGAGAGTGIAAPEFDSDAADEDLPSDEEDGPADDGDGESAPAAEPIHEYAAMLAGLDPETATPYRPWETYEVGQCVLHLAWEDCGVVVAKEDLPGGRKVIKCYFEDAGVVRLIEQAPR